jgi:hypothetical protein
MKAWIGKGRGSATPGLSTDEIMTRTRGEERSMIMVDANILLDVFTRDPVCFDW